MERSIGAWSALRYVLNPGAATGIVLTTTLLGLPPAALGSEFPESDLAADSLPTDDFSKDSALVGDVPANALPSRCRPRRYLYPR